MAHKREKLKSSKMIPECLSRVEKPKSLYCKSNIYSIDLKIMCVNYLSNTSKNIFSQFRRHMLKITNGHSKLRTRKSNWRRRKFLWRQDAKILALRRMRCVTLAQDQTGSLRYPKSYRKYILT